MNLFERKWKESERKDFRQSQNKISVESFVSDETETHD